jgi:hypothetical protein
MLNTSFKAAALEAGDGAALRYGSGSTKIMRLRLRNTAIEI